VLSLALAASAGAEGSPPSPPDIQVPRRFSKPTLQSCNGGTKIARGKRSTRPPRFANTNVQSELLPLLLYQMWQHRQADPARAVVPSVRSVVSSKTPEASAKTHTHNWCGRQRQAANTTQCCEAQRFLASPGGLGPLCCPAQIYPPVPVPQPSGGPSPVGQKHGPNAGHTRQRGVPKTQSKHAKKNPRGEGEMHQAHQIRILTTKRTEQGCGHNSADR